MKNITNATSAYVLALFSVVLFLEAGCSSSTMPDTSLSLLAKLAPGDILSRYDTSNIEGIIVPRVERYSIITRVFPASMRTNWDETKSWGEASFMDASGNPLDIGMVSFNKQLPQVPGSSDNWGGPSRDYLYGYFYGGTDLPIYTDGVTVNHVIITQGNGPNGSAIDSLTFGGMPSMTNIVRGQNISRDSDITVKWTGTSSDFVSISVLCWDSTGTNDTPGHGVSVGGYFNNTGSATLHLSKDQLQLGLADIELRKYEPKFITLSNGKRVAVICETCEEITVHIVD